MPRSSSLFTLLLVSAVFWGCSAPQRSEQPPRAEPSPPPAAPPPAPRPQPSHVTAPEPEDLSERGTINFVRKPCRQVAELDDLNEFDLNHDGSVDVVEVSRSGRVYCRQLDLNFDGAFDVSRFFDSTGRDSREEMDLDRDGRLDMVTTFRDGARLASIADTDHDGRGDAYLCFLNDRRVEQQVDRDHDGRAERWEWFDDQEQFIGSATDEDGDGRPDEPPPSQADTSHCPQPRF